MELRELPGNDRDVGLALQSVRAGERHQPLDQLATVNIEKMACAAGDVLPQEVGQHLGVAAACITRERAIQVQSVAWRQIHGAPLECEPIRDGHQAERAAHATRVERLDQPTERGDGRVFVPAWQQKPGAGLAASRCARRRKSFAVAGRGLACQQLWTEVRLNGSSAMVAALRAQQDSVPCARDIAIVLRYASAAG